MNNTRTLGCIGCPCSKSCSDRSTAAAPGGAGLAGCSRPNGLGFVFPDTSNIDLTDPKTWIIAALAAMLLYNLFFRSEQRERRAKRREAVRSARDRYRADLRRIREDA